LRRQKNYCPKFIKFWIKRQKLEWLKRIRRPERNRELRGWLIGSNLV